MEIGKIEFASGNVQRAVNVPSLPAVPVKGKLLAASAPLTRDEYLQMFKDLTDKMLATTTAKNNDYAGFGDPFANFREFGTFGFLVRMSDKWKRIRNLVGENRPPSVKDESVEDTLIDLATYCLLLLCWLRNLKIESANVTSK